MVEKYDEESRTERRSGRKEGKERKRGGGRKASALGSELDRQWSGEGVRRSSRHCVSYLFRPFGSNPAERPLPLRTLAVPCRRGRTPSAPFRASSTSRPSSSSLSPSNRPSRTLLARRQREKERRWREKNRERRALLYRHLYTRAGARGGGGRE